MAIHMKDIMKKQAMKNNLSFIEAYAQSMEDLKTFLAEKICHESFIWQTLPTIDEIADYGLQESLRLLKDEFIEKLEAKMMYYLKEDAVVDYKENYKLMIYKIENELFKSLYNEIYNIRED